MSNAPDCYMYPLPFSAGVQELRPHFSREYIIKD